MFYLEPLTQMVVGPVWYEALAPITSHVESKTEIKKRKDYMRSQWVVRDLNSHGFSSLLFRYDIEPRLNSTRLMNKIFPNRMPPPPLPTHNAIY